MDKRKRKTAVICMLAVLLLTSCKTATESPAKSEKVKNEKLKIGITFDTFVLERWTRDRDIFVSTAQKMGAQVDVQNANGDVEKQERQIQQFISEDVDTIVVVPVDCYALSNVVTQARNRGINVISYDRLLQGAGTDLFITVDSVRVGELMAETMKEKLPGGGDIIMIGGPKEDTNSVDVINGLKSGLEGSNLKIVSESYAKSWASENGFQAVSEAFQDIREFDAVMCGNDGLAGFAIKALSEQQLAGKIVVTGQDADLEACQRIVEGTQTMTVYKPIEEQARIAAECAVKMAKGEKAIGELVGRSQYRENEKGDEIPYYGLEPVSVTAENIDKIIIDSGFHVRNEVYLNVD